MARLHPMLEPYRASNEGPFDAVKAAHLLNRAGFGGTLDEIEKVRKLGVAGAIDWLMDFPDAPAEELSRSDLPDFSSIDGYPRNFREYRRSLFGKTPEERQRLIQEFMRANREAIMSMGAWWLKRMAYGPYRLQEKLTLFWHGHFTTSALDERSALLMWKQNELLRMQSAGNFREFVRWISRDPAMLDYLNNQQNSKRSPNENYARELMELFTLGIGNYSERDIKEAARAFTGWGHDGEAFSFRRNDHDYGEKIFFGKRGSFDGDDIIDLILAHRACAPYIAGRLFSFFAYPSSDTAMMASLGEVLRDARYELRPVLRTIFASKAFYSPQCIGSQIKSPVQLMAGTVRLLDADLPQTRVVNRALNQMGQVPLMPPNVKGWPGGRNWINSSTLFVRYNSAVALVGAQRARALRPQGRMDDEALVDHWIARLIQRPIAPEKRGILIESMRRNPNRDDAMMRMIQLIVSMPEYQLC